MDGGDARCRCGRRDGRRAGRPGCPRRRARVRRAARGVEIRTATPVNRIDIRDGRAVGVLLAGGEEIAASVVVSAADPKRTLLDLIDPVALGPTLGWRAANIRTPGVIAKVNLALSGLPRFGVPADEGDGRLRGRILIAPSLDAIERAHDDAKYGRISAAPILEATIPSLLDPGLVEGATAARRGAVALRATSEPRPVRAGDGSRGRPTGTPAELGDRVVAALEHSPGSAIWCWSARS